MALNVSRSLSYHSGLRPLLGGADVEEAAGMVGQVAERMGYEVQRTPSLEARERLVTELVHSAARAASNLVDRDNHRGWRDLGEDEAAR